MKQCFRDINFRKPVLAIIEQANTVIDRYETRMTSRQLYYQFIAKDLFPAEWVDDEYNRSHKLQAGTKNTLKNYKRLSAILNDARVAGLVDWDAIEDRTREPDMPTEFNSLTELARVATNSFRLPRWDQQPEYVELAVEKDALAGVLTPMCREFHVPLQVNRGYSSASSMKAWADRIIARLEEDWCSEATILYFGDFDPSGEDMVRDVRDRLLLLGVGEKCEACDKTLTVKKIGLTMQQIRQYRPPPNPAKMTDSRAAAYVEQHGTESWEVDALDPDVMQSIVSREIAARRDDRIYDAVVARETAQKAHWLKLVPAALAKNPGPQ